MERQWILLWDSSAKFSILVCHCFFICFITQQTSFKINDQTHDFCPLWYADPFIQQYRGKAWGISGLSHRDSYFSNWRESLLCSKQKTITFFTAIFRFYQSKYLLPRYFNQIYILGDTEAQVEDGLPVLYLVNHSSWWDGLLCFQAYQRNAVPLENMMMMEEAQLEKLRFFQRLGAFSIAPDKPKSLVETLRYVEEKLKNGQKVWIFPQGEIRHQDSRPLHVKRGVAKIMERFDEVAIKFVSMYYYLGEKQKLNAVLEFSTPVVVNGRMLEKEKNAARTATITIGRVARQYSL